MEGGGGGRKAKLTSQISVLDPAKIRDLIKLREDHNTFRRDSSLAGLTVDAVLGGDQRRSSTTSQVENNQQCRTLLDIICSDEDNSGAAYRGLVAQSNKKNGKKNSKKSIKERLRLLRSSRPVPTCDIPISKGRNTVNISNPFPPPQAPKRSTSTKVSSSTAFPAGIDAKQVADPIVPCNINEEDDDDKHEEQQQQQQQQQQPMLKNQEEEQVDYPIVPCNVNEADDDDKHEEQQQQPMLKNQEEEEEGEDDDDNPELKNDIDEPVTSKDDDELEEKHQPISKDQEEEEEEHQPISKNQEEEEDDDKSSEEEEEEENDVLRNATSRLLISELREVDDEINGSNKAIILGMKEDDDDDDDDDDEEEEEEPVKQVSLMALLEESMGAGDSEDEEEDALDIEDDVEVGGQYVCCVCMVRHNKGTCFSHCGHSFCRLCCKELFVGKGNCPRCNGYVMEIVEIF